jgi:hypothetical protein
MFAKFVRQGDKRKIRASWTPTGPTTVQYIRTRMLTFNRPAFLYADYVPPTPEAFASMVDTLRTVQHPSKDVLTALARQVAYMIEVTGQVFVTDKALPESATPNPAPHTGSDTVTPTETDTVPVLDTFRSPSQNPNP